MRLTIKLKLGMSLGLVTILLVGVSLLGLPSLGRFDTRLDAMLDGPVKRLDDVQVLRNTYTNTIRAEKGLLLSSNAEHAFDNNLLTPTNIFGDLLIILESIASPEGRPKWAELHQAWESFKPLDDKIRTLIDNGQKSDAVALSMGEARALTKVVEREVDGIFVLQQHQPGDARSLAALGYRHTRTLLLLMAAVSMLLAGGVARWISLQISTGLREVSGLAEAVATSAAQGDLAVQRRMVVRGKLPSLPKCNAGISVLQSRAKGFAMHLGKGDRDAEDADFPEYA